MTRRTLLDVATLIHDRIPGYCVTTETRRGGSGSIRVTWCTMFHPMVARAVAMPRSADRWVFDAPTLRESGPYTGRGWVERMAADIVAAVHEDARRHGRWGPEVNHG